MPHFTHEGASLAYRDEGDGLPLLALAGLTRDGRDFDYLARHLPHVRLIRLDSRGRGGSDWTGPDTYTVAQEARDALALLDHLGLARAAVIGSSRGGLLGLVIAATARDRLLGLCLNDVGPVLERDGLLRIGAYVGVEPSVATLEEVADRIAASQPGFAHVPPMRWQEEAVRHYTQQADHVGLTYDPALRQAFDAAMAAPLPELWPLFDACAGLPLAVIHGAASDVLSVQTVAEMRRRRPDLIAAEIPNRGHIPFLDEPEALAAIGLWLDLVAGGMRK
ncbi:alpha/beta hydrolase [Rhodobacter sp. KR11]|uniref:alpha/beta fold hydrolase n=1 Tax=Rhodobacter sp. KR11 TaxID=2974588 RepID=UPI0022220659|nr:alpha/beta hydrolase [Rhodobacter sp. KR11]MCW1918064.1 alpha/beta hydrolase [Rhodobacter sp. KR11]